MDKVPKRQKGTLRQSRTSTPGESEDFSDWLDLDALASDLDNNHSAVVPQIGNPVVGKILTEAEPSPLSDSDAWVDHVLGGDEEEQHPYQSQFAINFESVTLGDVEEEREDSIDGWNFDISAAAETSGNSIRDCKRQEPLVLIKTPTILARIRGVLRAIFYEGDNGPLVSRFLLLLLFVGYGQMFLRALVVWVYRTVMD